MYPMLAAWAQIIRQLVERTGWLERDISLAPLARGPHCMGLLHQGVLVGYVAIGQAVGHIGNEITINVVPIESGLTVTDDDVTA